MEQVVITVVRSGFLFAFLLAVSLWPRLVRRRALFLLGHSVFAASLIVIPIAMLYYAMTWNDPTRDTLRFFASVRTAHYTLLVVGFVLAISAMLPFPAEHRSLQTPNEG